MKNIYHSKLSAFKQIYAKNRNLEKSKREKKLHLTPSELKKADEILSSGKYLPKDHIIYNLALMEIKKELVIDFILSKFKAK